MYFILFYLELVRFLILFNNSLKLRTFSTYVPSMEARSQEGALGGRFPPPLAEGGVPPRNLGKNKKKRKKKEKKKKKGRKGETNCYKLKWIFFAAKLKII